MTYDELVLRSIGAAFTGDFDRAFNVSEKTRMPGKPIADDDDRDDSDSDAAEILHEPEAELIGEDTVVDVDVIVPQGDEGDAA